MLRLSGCPLCAVYWDDDCVGCPVMEKTGEPKCADTPFEEVVFAKYRGDGVGLLAAVDAEIAFLESLRDE